MKARVSDFHRSNVFSVSARTILDMQLAFVQTQAAFKNYACFCCKNYPL